VVLLTLTDSLLFGSGRSPFIALFISLILNLHRTCSTCQPVARRGTTFSFFLSLDAPTMCVLFRLVLSRSPNAHLHCSQPLLSFNVVHQFNWIMVPLFPPLFSDRRPPPMIVTANPEGPSLGSFSPFNKPIFGIRRGLSWAFFSHFIRRTPVIC